jgi:methyltransferase
MTLIPHWLVGLVALQRLFELMLSRRNTARLLLRGGFEVGAGHYRYVVAVHAAWLATLWLTVQPDADVSWPWLALYVALECARAWVMLTLGPYWTTRIIHLPGARLIRSGPYRFCSHPNYVVVAGEIAVLPLVFGQYYTAAFFSVLNATVLVWRIRVESTVLASRRRPGEGQ